MIKNEIEKYDETLLEEYKKEIIPKWWEWMPILSLSYETRLNSFAMKLPMNSPIKNEMVRTFSKVAAYSLGLFFVLMFLSPLLNFLTNKRVIKNIEG